jgi:hypothetical protein
MKDLFLFQFDRISTKPFKQKPMHYFQSPWNNLLDGKEDINENREQKMAKLNHEANFAISFGKSQI